MKPKRFAAAAAVALAAMSAAGAVLAEDAWIKRDVQARSATNPAADPVATFNQGAKVTVDQRQGAWAKVTLNGTSGWVAGDTLSQRPVNTKTVAFGKTKEDVQGSAGAAIRPVEPLANDYAKAKGLDPKVVDVQLRDIRNSVTAQMLDAFMTEGKVGTAKPAAKGVAPSAAADR